MSRPQTLTQAEMTLARWTRTDDGLWTNGRGEPVTFAQAVRRELRRRSKIGRLPRNTDTGPNDVYM
jgi:hypothetical protein